MTLVISYRVLLSSSSTKKVHSVYSRSFNVTSYHVMIASLTYPFGMHTQAVGVSRDPRGPDNKMFFFNLHNVIKKKGQI